MDQALARYLNDHLAGSSGALLLIQDLADNHGAPEARKFFVQLKDQVEADRALLENLLERIGENPSALLKLAGGVAAGIVGIKLNWEELEPGKLGLFEALEMLALGVHGKHLLWVALEEIATYFPEWDEIDFVELDELAIQQRDNIEFWRAKAALEVLVDKERRAGNCDKHS